MGRVGSGTLSHGRLVPKRWFANALQRPCANVVILVIVTQIETIAERHAPHFRGGHDVAVVIRKRRDDNNLRLKWKKT